MSPTAPLKLLLPLLALHQPASAADAWHCWYNLDQHVACVVRQPESARLPRAAGVGTPENAAAITPPATLRAVTPPLSMHLLRDQHSALRGGTILIPLHTEPFDHSLVAELAQAVMCGRQADCTAHYGERPAMTLADAADFADANDPLLARAE